MRVQVSARSGTITPNSRLPNRVSVSGRALQVVLDRLVDGDPAGPPRRRVAAALHVAGEQDRTRQQATDAPHVPVAVALHAVVDAAEQQRAVLDGVQRVQTAGEGELAGLLELIDAQFLRPERLRDHPVGAEDDRPTAAASARAGPPSNRRPNARLGRFAMNGAAAAGQAEVLEEVAAGGAEGGGAWGMCWRADGDVSGGAGERGVRGGRMIRRERLRSSVAPVLLPLHSRFIAASAATRVVSAVVRPAAPPRRVAAAAAKAARMS